MKYNLVVDKRAIVWRRERVSIEAESLEDAVNKGLWGNYDEVGTVTLIETGEFLDPDYNDGQATTEIYSEDLHTLYKDNLGGGTLYAKK